MAKKFRKNTFKMFLHKLRKHLKKKNKRRKETLKFPTKKRFQFRIHLSTIFLILGNKIGGSRNCHSMFRSLRRALRIGYFKLKFQGLSAYCGFIEKKHSDGIFSYQGNKFEHIKKSISNL